ncbi:MAG: helix-turn-helix domain-containing protein [Hydrogenophaga sp.]|uniref:GlxA family transcriptional regulator n=1 Tax=Hydrogenophaga sp. TaxID=1904254 RepID=UPI0016A4D64C|nr:helix-turn-helix domain-containing protein [Hydrogenophaga sp.]NIM43757.1 helix-turn-helix domain-containing protein [Hydrogenophaga sp.]NIN28823.1 helix-turn-helix domain-containing protein [Hydrogenophaga sp.]NIN33282.1 helix-turn-helix domain-containing protein [Hydrogenophaga sp.]NIN57957.1 helix-turn-helix domain-containing protein [Hydrogenophaga sp.]NIO54255.1 helix-turn-helix domain-containing protein [Hydrogenophaga sp.]
MDTPAPSARAALHVSLVALPEAAAATLFGIHDVMNAFSLMGGPGTTLGAWAPFEIEIVGERPGTLDLVSGVPVTIRRAVDQIDRTDIVIVPSVVVRGEAWVKDRYPGLVRWAQAMHEGGALLCSACSGIFLLAETGLFDGRDATVHFGYARSFAATHPKVPIHPERVLVISGQRQELVTSGASTTWHDMVLYLIARHAGATAAQEVARLFALQWHQDGLTPFMVFEGRKDHGDAEIEQAQQWLAQHFSVASPVDEMIKRSRLAERTFKRRFAAATGLAPIDYVQRLRVEDAKRRLERTDAPVDEISWRVGYEDAAFFRRLFRRTTGMSPGAYRKRFQVPAFARP